MQLTTNDLLAAGACKKGLAFFEKNFENGKAAEEEMISLIQSNKVPYEMLFWCLDNLTIKEEILKVLIEKCNIINSTSYYKSYNVTDSFGVFNSHDVTNSRNISYSSDIINSTMVLNSKDVDGSKNIYNSDFITNSSKVLKSQNVYNSENIINTSYADNSKNINLGKNIINSNIIYDSKNITDSYFCSNCSDLSNCLFCYDLKDKEYCIFNKPVSNQQFISIRNFLLRFLPIEINYVEWQNETEINISNIKDNLKIIEWHKELPERLITWIKTLPQYDPYVMYNITFLYCFLEDIT